MHKLATQILKRPTTGLKKSTKNANKALSVSSFHTSINTKKEDPFIKEYQQAKEKVRDEILRAKSEGLMSKVQRTPMESTFAKIREVLATELAQNKDFEEGLKRFNRITDEVLGSFDKEPVRVAVTGASGQIGYALLFRIASGQMFGPSTPVILQLLELPQAMNTLKGVVMELEDCAFPLLRGIVATDDPMKAFERVDWALLVGAKPRSKGMERADLLKDNAMIFSAQGQALNTVAKGKDTRVVVVGNPANTNALIAARNAPGIPAKNFTAMTRLDHNRALAQLVNKTGCRVQDVSHFAIWGNHSATQYPDVTHAMINGKPAQKVINDDKWISDVFIPTVQQRGAAIIAARGASSAASAASSLVDHVRDWHFGTNGEWTSMAVFSPGDYGVTQGLYYSYPVICAPYSVYDIVKDLPVDSFSAERMEKTHQELLQERDAVASLLPRD